jgi:hypothetical protein
MPQLHQDARRHPGSQKKRRNPEIAPSTLLQRELAHTGRMAQPA